jgi:hypothetical protein
MAHTNTWNAANEASPADSDNVSDGAGKIRTLKLDIRERIAKDHYMAIAGTDADHGEHSKITLQAPLGADPANVAEKGFLYTKDVSAKVELFWEDEDGNVIQLTTAGIMNDRDVPTGEIILFEKDTVVTGYTLKTDYDDMAVFITKGSVAGGKYGGVSWYAGNVSTGTADGDTASKLVDSGADFVSDGVAVGDVAINTDDGVAAMVTAVDDLNTLSLDSDAFPDGNEAYQVKNQGDWTIDGFAGHIHTMGTHRHDLEYSGTSANYNSFDLIPVGSKDAEPANNKIGYAGNTAPGIGATLYQMDGRTELDDPGDTNSAVATHDGTWRPAARTFTRQVRN